MPWICNNTVYIAIQHHRLDIYSAGLAVPAKQWHFKVLPVHLESWRLQVEHVTKAFLEHPLKYYLETHSCTGNIWELGPCWYIGISRISLDNHRYLWLSQISFGPFDPAPNTPHWPRPAPGAGLSVAAIQCSSPPALCAATSGGKPVHTVCTLCTLCTLYKTGNTAENKILEFRFRKEGTE